MLSRRLLTFSRWIKVPISVKPVKNNLLSAAKVEPKYTGSINPIIPSDSGSLEEVKLDWILPRDEKDTSSGSLYQIVANDPKYSGSANLILPSDMGSHVSPNPILSSDMGSHVSPNPILPSDMGSHVSPNPILSSDKVSLEEEKINWILPKDEKDTSSGSDWIMPFLTIGAGAVVVGDSSDEEDGKPGRLFNERKMSDTANTPICTLCNEGSCKLKSLQGMSPELIKIFLYGNDEAEDKGKEVIEKSKNRNYTQEWICNGGGELSILQHWLMNNMKESLTDFDKDNTNFQTLQTVLASKECLKMFLCSGDVAGNKWKEAIDIFHEIITIDPKIVEEKGYRLRLAIAVALTFSTPVQSLADPSFHIPAVSRYKSFARWFEEGELFPSFKDLSVWQMRYVVGSWAMDEELVWARQNVLADFKCPEKIGEAAHSMVKYCPENEKGVSVHTGSEYYDFRPVTLALLHEVGAVCGGVSKFGCAVAQAFGIPAMPVAQPGHCAYLWWQNGCWKLSNDCGGINKSWRHDGIQMPWRDEARLVLIMEKAQSSFDQFCQSEVLRIAAGFLEGKAKSRLLLEATSKCWANYAAWKERLEMLMKGEGLESWGKSHCEINPKENKVVSAKATVKVSDCEERAGNVVDGTGSEWWSENESAWLEIHLREVCNIEEIKIQWWGTSVSKKYSVKASSHNEDCVQKKTNLDETKSPSGYNSWSEMGGWEEPARVIRFELEDGSLDPWSSKKYFGIRQILIIGREISQKCSLQFTNMKVSSTKMCNEEECAWWTEDDEASTEFDVEGIRYVENVKVEGAFGGEYRIFTSVEMKADKDHDPDWTERCKWITEEEKDYTIFVNSIATKVKVEMRAVKGNNMKKGFKCLDVTAVEKPWKDMLEDYLEKEIGVDTIEKTTLVKCLQELLNY